jgi:hypothetical protein
LLDPRVGNATRVLLLRRSPLSDNRFVTSYDVYQEFTKRHFQVSYKVHELISARLKIEKQQKQSAAADHRGFFKRLFCRSGCGQRKCNSSLPSGITTAP